MHIHVLAACLRLHRAQLSVGQRAKKREQAAHQPGQVYQLGCADRLHHLGWHEKDAAADDGPDHHRPGVADAKIARQFGSGGELSLPWHFWEWKVYAKSA